MAAWDTALGWSQPKRPGEPSKKPKTKEACKLPERLSASPSPHTYRSAEGGSLIHSGSAQITDRPLSHAVTEATPRAPGQTHPANWERKLKQRHQWQHTTETVCLVFSDPTTIKNTKQNLELLSYTIQNVHILIKNYWACQKKTGKCDPYRGIYRGKSS